jgi:hypothetical protein
VSDFPIQRFNDLRILGTPKPWRRRHVATARVLLRDISKILFSDKPVNVPVIK